MRFLDYLRMVLTGLVSGAARMLPVSDSAHAILLTRLFGNTSLYTDRFLMLCYAAAGLGSAFALAFTFFNKLNVFSQYKTDDQKRNTQDLVRQMLLSVVPYMVVAAVFELLLPNVTEKVFLSPFMAAGLLILYGAFMLIAERKLKQKEPEVLRLSELPVRTVLFVGLAEVLSYFAGAGPVETILIVALLLSSSRYVAAEFSYYASIPAALVLAMFRAVRYFVFDAGTMNGPKIFSLLMAFIGASVVTFALARTFLHMLKRRTTPTFAVYRIILGVGAIVLAAITG